MDYESKKRLMELSMKRRIDRIYELKRSLYGWIPKPNETEKQSMNFIADKAERMFSCTRGTAMSYAKQAYEDRMIDLKPLLMKPQLSKQESRKIEQSQEHKRLLAYRQNLKERLDTLMKAIKLWPEKTEFQTQAIDIESKLAKVDDELNGFARKEETEIPART